MSDLVKRITEYLANGGLWNPEFADHQAVRDLLIECHDRIEELEELADRVKNGFQGGCWCCEIVGEKNLALQRKYEALVEVLHDKMNEIDNRRGAGSQLPELDELRALLEDDNG